MSALTHDPGIVVLVVDNEVKLRNFTVQSLTRAGYKVLEARSGDEAMIVSEQCAGNIDVLIVEHILDGPGGRKIAERMRKARRKIKVIHTSYLSEEQLMFDGGMASNTWYLGKPYTVTELLEAVNLAVHEPDGHAATRGIIELGESW